MPIQGHLSTTIQEVTVALFTRTDSPFGITNQKSSHSQSWLGFSSSKSNSLKSLGISFEISRMLMCLPTQDLEPNPKGTFAEGLISKSSNNMKQQVGPLL